MTRKRKVIVKWRDAIHGAGWQDSSDTEDDTVHSVGWIISKTKKLILLAQSIGCGLHANTIQIPVPMIQSIRTLVVKQK
jgi:hypothetical protein